MEMTEKEAHCVARLIQGALFADDIIAGCEYCKFRCLDDPENPMLFAGEIRERLEAETGVDLNALCCPDLPRSEFPHSKFLKNANEKVKAEYLKRFEAVRVICEE